MTARENAPTPFLLTINGEQIASNSSKISQLKDAKVISSSSDLIFYINTKGELIQLHDKLKSYPFPDNNVQVYFITSGNNHSIAFAKDGEKYTAFGIGNTDNFIKNDYKNKIIAEWETLPDEIVNKRLVNGSCGNNFTFYLTVDGSVYLFQEQKLDFVQSLYGIGVISLAAGNNHCVALSSTRNVYIHQGKKFEKIDKLVGIDKILYHSAALDNEGIAYAWRCDNGCKIHKINVDQIKDIAFFNERYLSCITKTNSLYVIDLNDLSQKFEYKLNEFSRIFHCRNGLAVFQTKTMPSQEEIIPNNILSKGHNDGTPKLLYINKDNIDLFFEVKNNKNLLKATFSSLSAINGSFIKSNQPESTEDCLVDFDLVIEFYNKLKETKRMKEFNKVFTNTINSLMKRQMTNLESSKLRFLVVGLLHPLETKSDNDLWRTIIEYINRSNSRETLKEWFTSFDKNILESIVHNLLKFFDKPKANERYTFNQDVARVLSIIYFANKERKSQILPVSFIHEKFSKSLDPIQDLKNTSSYIENFSWFFNIEQKTKFLYLKIEDFVKHLPNDTNDRQTFEIEVNPEEDNVLEKVKMKLTQISDFVIFLPIVIRDGSGIPDDGNLRNEFFRSIEMELKSGDNPILKECSNNYYWFNENFNDIEMLKIIGTIFGCMIINHWHLDYYSFPLFFYEKLLYDDPPEIVVMSDNQSSDDGNIRSSLEHAGSEEDINLPNENSESSDCTEFTNDEYSSSSSEKNGSEGEISESEKMSEKGKMQLDAFITGFRRIRENCILECFDPKELKQLMESS